MGRRLFLSRSALAAAAVALAACSGVGLDGTTGPANVSLSVKLSDYASLATVGGVALVTASGTPLAIVRTGQATFVALSRICPHEGATIGSNGAGAGFTCPRHGAQFTSNGSWQGGQRTSSMRAYTTNFDSATGIITVG
jgi:cytochrome b6-f complex iron-sulfur subunit